MPEENQPDKRKARFVLGGMTLLFLLIGVVIFLYWHEVWQFEESTDDAYVDGNQIAVTPRVAGVVQTLYADETDIVQEGTLLVSLDPTDYRLAFEETQHLLAEEVRQVAALFDLVEQLKAEKRMREIEKIKTDQDYRHRKELLSDGAVTMEEYEHAEATYLSTLQMLKAVDYRLAAAQAEVAHTTIETHPRVDIAKDRLCQAFLNLQRCHILAPATGMLAQRQTQVGESVKPGAPLMKLIPLDQMWVNANFKETQLEHVRLGQPVTMTSDLYGSDVVFHGKVAGLWPGTGSVFSVLPPQNATGNWIKIVQRLPVRIRLEPEELSQYPLRLGLSINVDIDTHDLRGERLPSPTSPSPLFQTSIYNEPLKGMEELIAQIIQENLPTHNDHSRHE